MARKRDKLILKRDKLILKLDMNAAVFVEEHNGQLSTSQFFYQMR